MKFILFVIILTSLCIGESEKISDITVIDGDTIELEDRQRVRLIGIDSTEFGQRCHREGKEKLKELVEGKEIKLISDRQDKDKYGRLLRYVYIDELSINLEMVMSGNAYAIKMEPNTRYYEELSHAQSEAIKEKRGCLWE